MVWVYTCQNATLLEITYCGSYVAFGLINIKGHTASDSYQMDRGIKNLGLLDGIS